MSPCPRPPRLLVGLLSLLGAAPARAGALRDAGRPMPPGTPVALVVCTPGLAPPAEQGLVEALEAEGVDAWTVDLPTGTWDREAALGEWLPAARRDLPGGAHALVGYGLGGTLAARAARLDPPAALALLGAPLSFPSSALTDWLATLPVPADGVLPEVARDARWGQAPALEVLLGGPPPPLEHLGAAWLRDLQGWAHSGEIVDLRGYPGAVWAGVGDLDELGPAEVVRPWLPAQATFVRFGLLRLDPQPYRSLDLLADPRPARALARWVAAQLVATAPPPG